MPLTDLAKTVIERPLPKEKIRQRPGKAGMTYDYVTPDFVIDLLNEAFEYRWSTEIFYEAMHGDTAVVGMKLTVFDVESNPIVKSQFGSCEVGRGMGPGEAFKGAASDAMKKSATLLGVALELYQEDESASGTSASKFAKPVVPPRAPTSPAAPVGPAVPRPVASVPVPPPPAGPPLRELRERGAPPAPRPSPFASGNTAAVTKPAVPSAPVPISVPKPVSAAASAPKVNPFASKTAGAGPNSTQMNALTNLSQKKGLAQPAMIALAGIVDEMGNPRQSFEELSHAEAIQVIKASQL